MAKRKRDERDENEALQPAPAPVERPKGPQTSSAGTPWLPPVGGGFTK